MKRKDKFLVNCNLNYWIFILILVIFLTLPTVLAHTGIVESTPKNGDIVTEELKKITMKFESKVENLSTFKIINENNQTIDLTSLSKLGNIMEGSLTEPLPNGFYTVQWNIVGADGHPIKGEFSFTVESNPQIDSAPKEKVEVPLAITDSKDSNIIVIAMVGFLVAGLLIISSIWVLKRGRNHK